MLDIQKVTGSISNVKLVAQFTCRGASQPEVDVLTESWQAGFAILVKTGTLTAQRRVPIQLLTFLAHIRNFILVGAQEDAAGRFKVLDVATPAIQHIRDFHVALAADGAAHIGSKSAQSGGRALAWKPENETVGYILDRYKNIPGWGALQDAFPDAAWYIAIDDDTYWLQHNFMSFIDGLDADVPHYLGNPFLFDPSKNTHTGEAFVGGQLPHGGEGMIVSRRAMQLMRQHLQKCIERVVEATMLFGDVQTTLCLRIAGVQYNATALEFNTLMMNHPPGLPDYDRGNGDLEWQLRGVGVQWPQQDPCAQVFAIHHLRPEQMQRVFEVERAAAGHMPTYADIWWGLRRQNASLSVNEMHLEMDDISTNGKQLASVTIGTPEECRISCTEMSACLQWTFSRQSSSCMMRETYERIITVTTAELGDLVSGAVLNRFKCQQP